MIKKGEHRFFIKNGRRKVKMSEEKKEFDFLVKNVKDEKRLDELIKELNGRKTEDGFVLDGETVKMMNAEVTLYDGKAVIKSYGDSEADDIEGVINYFKPYAEIEIDQTISYDVRETERTITKLKELLTAEEMARITGKEQK